MSTPTDNPRGTEPSSGDASRPFQVGFTEAELTDLRRRISATRWPERETVDDDSQGVRLELIQDLARYWATDYDWSKCEARLNGLPNFITEIDGLDIHFIHVRSEHEDALPLIVTHGWPGSANSWGGALSTLGAVSAMFGPTHRSGPPSPSVALAALTSRRARGPEAGLYGELVGARSPRAEARIYGVVNATE